MSASPSPGTIVFVDCFRWIGFDQMAAALRRLGVRVVRVTPEQSRPARLVDAILYDEAVRYSGVDELTAVLDRFDRPDLLDVVAVDELVPYVARMTTERMPSRVAERLRARARWVDKAETARFLAAAGVPVPSTLPAASTTPEEAVAALGLPLVVKARIGAGGSGVCIARTLEDVAAGVATLAAEPSTLYYERFVPGPMRCYTAAAVAGEVVEEVGYAAHARDEDCVGPTARIVVDDDPALLAAGRATAVALGIDGLVGLDVVGTGDEALVVDVNYRVPGPAVLLRGAGVRFDKTYLAALTSAAPGRGACPAPAEARGRRRPRAGTVLTQFPARVQHEIMTRGVLDLRLLSTDARPFVRWAGGRYVLATVAWLIDEWTFRRGIGLGSPGQLGRGLVRELRRRPTPAGPGRARV